MPHAIVSPLLPLTIALMFGAYVFGRITGFRRGMRIANANNKALIDQLKQANAFAAELRQQELYDRKPQG